MRTLSAMCFAVLLGIPALCQGAAPPLRLASPNKKFQLLVEAVPSPFTEGQQVTSYSICDAQGKVLQKLGMTEFPVIAVKWHKSAAAVMILEHLARQPQMNLIVLRHGVWKEISVAQFDEPMDSFAVIGADSTKASFTCYYLSYSRKGDENWAYCTEVDVATGKAALRRRKRLRNEDMPFYANSIDGILYQIKQSQTDTDAPPHYHSSQSDDEPDWYGVRW